MRWYHSFETIECKTPSRNDEVDFETEARYRKEGVRFIMELGNKLGLYLFFMPISLCVAFDFVLFIFLYSLAIYLFLLIELPGSEAFFSNLIKTLKVLFYGTFVIRESSKLLHSFRNS